MTILFAIMYTPCYLMKKYTAFSIIYMVLWFFIICLFTALLTKKYMTEIRTLKKEKGWYITKKSVARVDTNVSKIKNKMPALKDSVREMQSFEHELTILLAWHPAINLYFAANSHCQSLAFCTKQKRSLCSVSAFITCRYEYRNKFRSSRHGAVVNESD